MGLHKAPLLFGRICEAYLPCLPSATANKLLRKGPLPRGVGAGFRVEVVANHLGSRSRIE